jgi:hypothetical protein
MREEADMVGFLVNLVRVIEATPIPALAGQQPHYFVTF